jgi:hypothetical protein
MNLRCMQLNERSQVLLLALKTQWSFLLFQKGSWRKKHCGKDVKRKCCSDVP